MGATLLDTFRTFVVTNLLDSILTILVTIVLTAGGLVLINWATRLVSARITATEMDAERRSRLNTLISASKDTLRILVLALATVIVLASFGIDFGPLLAAAGIAGLAISLGAQTLIKDFFGGIIILLEDQYRVGDSIRVNSVDGVVEQITLRRTNVRNVDGTLYVVPNGEIRTVGNTTRDWSRAAVDLNLTYEGDMRRAIDVLKAAMAQAAEDPAIRPFLLEPPEILGYNQTNDLGVRVRMQAKVKPGQQWGVARQLRRAALDALQEAGVPIAQPYYKAATSSTA